MRGKKKRLAKLKKSIFQLLNFRLMWACIQLFGAYSLYYLITTSYQGFVANPLVTTLHDTIYPVKFIPFPAVTVCSNNRISKKEATKFAKELSLIDPEKRDEEFFLNQIKFLGRAYDFETENEHLMTAFQQFLDEISVASITPITENSTLKEQMKFSKIIKRLTPRCEDLVLKCFFNSKIYPCMLKYEMLEQRKSIYGYCCSFNYLNRKDSNPLNTPYYSEVTGKDMGLILLIDQMQDDYFYNIFNNVGVTILIHGHDEYPDPLTGSASERLILPGEEVFIRVDGSNIHSQDDILSYKAEQRQCLFPNEILQYNGRYARSECFLSCKVRSIQALCDCLPFNIPKTTIGIGSGEPKTCTLQHVPCLNKYKGSKFFI
jgi:acid-sensing ion channel, other